MYAFNVLKFKGIGVSLVQRRPYHGSVMVYAPLPPFRLDPSPIRRGM